MAPVCLVWDDAQLTVLNAPTFLDRILRYTHKSLEWNKDKFRREAVRTKVNLFNDITTGSIRTIQTMPGLIDLVRGALEERGITYRLLDNRLPLPAPRLDLMCGFRFSQRQLVEDFLKAGRSGCLEAPTRYGKCLGRGTSVMMADGSTKPVEEIAEGDLVMGYDGTPRRAIGVVRGWDEMYRITPNAGGQPWTCTQDHILCLWRTPQGSKKKSPNLDRKEFLFTARQVAEASDSFKHLHKLVRRAVDFKGQPVPCDPYVFGTWIGDGHKRILPEFIFNTREVRLQTLAGIIDTDGFTNNMAAYSVVTKWKDLCLDIVFLARSLGFLVSHSAKSRTCHKPDGSKVSDIYFEIGISGPVENIPVRIQRKKIIGLKHRRNPLISGFTIEPVGVDEFFGFELEGPDKLFLLGDFTVTHNTSLMVNTLRAFPTLPTVVTAPGVDLVRQLHEELQEKLPGRKIAGLYSGSRKIKDSPDITVASMDSLHKCDIHGTRLLLIDEPHSAVTATRAPLLTAFTQARRYGYGATLDGRFDDADILITGLIGPTLVRRTYTEAVAEGAICPITVAMLRVPFRPFRTGKRDIAYKFTVWENSDMHALVARICREVLPPEWQTLIFIEHEKQAEAIMAHMPEGTIAMAKRLSPKERAELTERVKSGEVRRCIASDIYACGVTFHEVRALVNTAGGGASIGCIQKPGRLAEIRPGKKGGLVVDFIFENNNAPGGPPEKDGMDACAMIERDSWARHKVYKDKGYAVHVVSRVDEMRSIAQSLL